MPIKKACHPMFPDGRHFFCDYASFFMNSFH